MLTTTVNLPAPASMTTWAASGACRDSDPELFFPVTETGAAASQLARAKAVCAGCPVRDQCLQFALDSGQAFGVWGGTTGEERRRLRRRQMAVFIPVTAGLLLVVALLLVLSGARTRCTGTRAAGQGTARTAAAPRSVPGRGGLACLFPCVRAHLLRPRGTVAGEMK